ncbi:MAG: GDP-mannose 4,6-dehydratase [Pseudomonadota bacterium]
MSSGGGPVLVTGATGFVGVWALDDLRRRFPGEEIWATSDRPTPPVGHPGPYRTLDLGDEDGLRGLIRECRPGRVLHLAGALAGDDVERLLAVNAGGTERLLRALAEAPPEGSVRVVLASSAAVYGLVPAADQPVSEACPLRPVTPYAVSKTAQERVAISFGETAGLHVVRARLFNLLGPGQPAHLVPMCFLAQLREIRRGAAPPPLRVGNLLARRDFVDVRDAVRALGVLLEQGEAGAAYNVASGVDVGIGEVLTRLQAIEGLDVEVEVDPTRRGAGADDRIRADVARIAHLGWRAARSLDDSLRDMWAQG